MNKKEKYNELLSNILPLAKQIAALQKKAAKLGLFMDERELVKCSGCDLSEDVSFDGRLISYHRDSEDRSDSGLRFIKTGKNIYKCPICGTKNKIKNL